MNPLVCEDGCSCGVAPIMLCRYKVTKYNDHCERIAHFIRTLRLLELGEEVDWGTTVQSMAGRQVEREYEQ